MSKKRTKGINVKTPEQALNIISIEDTKDKLREDHNTGVRDGLMNVMTTMKAQGRDVTSPFNSFYSTEFMLSPSQNENIYMDSWIGKKVIEIPRDYIFKNGFTLKIEGKQQLETDVLRLFKKLDLETKIKMNEMNKRIYGGSVLFPRNPFQDPLRAFDPTIFNIAPSLTEFTTMDSSYLAVMPNTDILSENYFQPERISLAGYTADHTNCIIFRGVKVPRRRIPKYRYIGMSVFQNIFQAMIMDDYISKGIPNMVWRNNRWYYKVEGLNELCKDGNVGLALTRFSLIEDTMNVLSAGIIDKNDEVNLISQNFGGLADLDSRSVERLSGATNIPAMVLIGKSPDGMNATGNGDLECFYNWIESEQKEIVPQMNQVFTILIAMLTGETIPFEFTFNKPNQISTSKQIEIDEKVLSNAQKMDQLSMPEDVIIDYLVKYGLVTQEKAKEVLEYLQERNEANQEIMQQNSATDYGKDLDKEDA